MFAPHVLDIGKLTEQNIEYKIASCVNSGIGRKSLTIVVKPVTNEVWYVVDQFVEESKLSRITRYESFQNAAEEYNKVPV